MYKSYDNINRENGRSQLYDISNRLRDEHSLIAAQQEALKRAAVLKHRKVSTQLKLDMVQRELTNPRRPVTVHELEDDHFYRRQVTELTGQLQDIGQILERAEREAFYVRRRLLRRSGFESSEAGLNGLLSALSSSQPSVATIKDGCESRFSRTSLKSRALHMLMSPRLRRKPFSGELRAVASLSSLNTMSPSPTPYEETPVTTKEAKLWKSPLRLLGNFMDSRIIRRLGGSAKRTKSADTILQEYRSQKARDELKISGLVLQNVRPFSEEVHPYMFSSASESESEEETDVPNQPMETFKTEKTPATGHTNEIDPTLMAEIEDFEKMAAEYISQHTQELPS